MIKLPQGIVTSLVTPFREDERVDYTAWQKIIDFQIASGVDGLLATGGPGEFFSLDEEERIVTLRFCRQAIASRVPLYGNVGAVSTRETIRLAQRAEEEKIDYLVVVTPWFLKPTPDELADHYIDICNAVQLPVLAYNNPERTGVRLTAEVIERVIAKCGNFIGIEDSSGDPDQLRAFVALSRERPFSVLVGRDHMILRALELGCQGAVSACANIMPRAFADLDRAWREGRIEDAERLQGLIEPLRSAIALHTFPSILKEAMSLLGFPAGPCRKPVGPVPEPARLRLKEILRDLDSLNLLPLRSQSSAGGGS